MDTRFDQAMKQEEDKISAGLEFFEVAMDVAKEIAERGAAGAELTEAEKKFTRATAKFIIMGLLNSSTKK